MTQLTSQSDRAIALEPSLSAELRPATIRSLIADFHQLTKSRITFMVVVTAYIGFEVGMRMLEHRGIILSRIGPFGLPPWVVMWLTIAGTGLCCMGASALNQWMERDIDKAMRRTANRPLPAGRVSPAAALLLGVTLCVCGVLLLATTVGMLTAFLAVFTIVSYAFIYTPMKRVSSTSTIVGAVPGAMPPMIGYAAATGRIDVAAGAMFGIMFLWQLPHFLAIAWMYKDEYAAAGLPMLPVVDGDGRATCRQMLCGCFALVPLGLLPTALHMTGLIYFVGALVCGLVFLGFAVCFVRNRTRRNAKAVFFASLVYLPVVFALMLVDPA